MPRSDFSENLAKEMFGADENLFFGGLFFFASSRQKQKKMPQVLMNLQQSSVDVFSSSRANICCLGILWVVSWGCEGAAGVSWPQMMKNGIIISTPTNSLCCYCLNDDGNEILLSYSSYLSLLVLPTCQLLT